MKRKTLLDYLENSLLTGLFVSFFLNIHKVFLPSVLGGVYNEYADVSLYLSDLIFVPLAIILILRYKINNLSIYEICSTWNIVGKVVMAMLALLALSFLSLFYTDSLNISLRSFLTLFEIISFFIYILSNMFHVEHQSQNTEVHVPRGTLLDQYIIILKNLALFNSFLVFIQFFLQHSIGLKWLGESSLVVGSSGIATISFFGEKILRGYGLFAHPNILAAFLSLTLIVIYLKNVPRGTMNTKKCSTWNNEHKKMFHVEHWQEILIFLALILTFSRTGIIVVVLFYLINVPRGTLMRVIDNKCFTPIYHQSVWNSQILKMFHVEHLVLLIIAALIFFGASLSTKSLSEREITLHEYAQISQTTFLGHGIGSYGLALYSQLESLNNSWSIQPVHNTFLIYYYELGLLGLFVFVIIFMFMFHVEHLDNRKAVVSIIVLPLLFSLSDHFYVTIPQGQMIFWTGVFFAALFSEIDTV